MNEISAKIVFFIPNKGLMYLSMLETFYGILISFTVMTFSQINYFLEHHKSYDTIIGRTTNVKNKST